LINVLKNLGISITPRPISIVLPSFVGAETSLIWTSCKRSANLSVSSPANASIGFQAEISITGILTNESGEISRHTHETFSRIIGPDLSLLPTDIALSNEEPVEGETITISAQMNNIGEVNATNVSVILIVDDVQVGGLHITPIIEPGTSVEFSTDWVSMAGDHDITIAIDPDNSIDEHTEENNNATRTIRVSNIHVDDSAPWPYVRMVIAIMLVIAIAIILIFLKIKKKKDNKK